jgi:outer membrane protein assembly factor BamA
MNTIEFSKYKFFPGILLFTFLFISIHLLAQDDQKNLRNRFEKLFSKDLKFIGNPIIQNSPETGIKMGLAGNYFFKTSKDSFTRSSNTYLQIAYTTKRQFIFEPIWNIFSPHEKYIFRGRAGYLDFTDHYWGLGPSAGQQAKQDLSYKRIYIQSKLLRNIYSKWFVGINYRYSYIYNIRWASDIPEVDGNEGSLVSGFGPNIQADFRENPFSPRKGWYLDVFWSGFGRGTGSEFAFSQFQIDYRHYIPLWSDRQVLALELFGDFSGGELPFRELPRLGSSFLMRGFFEGRFRDRQYAAFQAEWRQPVYKRIHASAFAGAGEVAPNLDAFQFDRIKLAGGLGLRFLLNPSESVFVRFDFAFNNEGNTGFYIRINDAF